MNKTGLRIVCNGDGSYEFERVEKPREFVPSLSGSRYRSTFLAVYDNGHNRRFYKDKDYDQFARTQSFKDSCVLSNIVKRYENGDISVLQQVRGMYCDTTGMPVDSRSAHDIINRSRSVFERMSDEEKERYHGDFKNFIGNFGSTASINEFVESRMKAAAPAAAAPAAAPAAAAPAAAAPAAADFD